MKFVAAPLPTERIVMVDVRNLDPLEKQLIDATDVTVASVAPASLALKKRWGMAR